MQKRKDKNSNRCGARSYPKSIILMFPSSNTIKFAGLMSLQRNQKEKLDAVATKYVMKRI